LVEDGHLALTYLENRPAIATRLVGGRAEHAFVMMQAKGKESQNLVPLLFQELTGKEGRGRRLARKLLDRMSKRTYVNTDLDKSLQAIEHAAYTDRLVPQILAARGISQQLPAESRFRVHRENDGFVVDTNLDFVLLNAEYKGDHSDQSLVRSSSAGMSAQGSMNPQNRGRPLTCRHDNAIEWKRVSAYAITAAGVAGIHLARPDREVQSLTAAWRIPS
jgi:hypothetical protein